MNNLAGVAMSGVHHARDNPLMTPFAVADLLEQYAQQVRSLPGISRTNPHVFVESKSELAGEMISEAKRLRTMAIPVAPVRLVGEIGTGRRAVRGREIRVERRRRA